MKGGNLNGEDYCDPLKSVEKVNKPECCTAVAKEQLDLVKKSKEEETNLKVKLTAVKVTEQPPQWLKRGEKFNLTVQLLSTSKTPLQIVSLHHFMQWELCGAAAASRWLQHPA